MDVSFEKKSAKVRFLHDKVGLREILKCYDVTPFTVTAKSSVATNVRMKTVAVRAWTKRPKTDTDETAKNGTSKLIELFVELTPAKGSRFSSKPAVSVSSQGMPPALKQLGNFQHAKTPQEKAAERFSLRLEEQQGLKPGRHVMTVQFQAAIKAGSAVADTKGQIDAIVIIDPPKITTANAPAGGVALVGGTLDLRLGHLCDQKGCVNHLFQSVSDFPSLAGVRPQPDLKNPRATAYVRGGKAIDVWALREKLRSRGVEIAGMTPRDMKSYLLRVDLVRFQEKESGDVHQCPGCRQRVVDSIKKLQWIKDVQVAGGGLTVRPRWMDGDLVQLLDGITDLGTAPAAVWLVPAGVAMPKAPPPQLAHAEEGSDHGRGEEYATIRFDFGHAFSTAPVIRNLLEKQKWAGGVRLVDSNDSVNGWLAPNARKFAPLTPLLDALRVAGHVPKQTRLAGFGDIRITVDFAHLCGDVEYSKPPKARKSRKQKNKSGEKSTGKKKTDGKKKESTKKKKKFVPRPLRPAATSNGRKAIEAAVQRVSWVKNGIFRKYHVRPEFKGPHKLYLSLQAKGEDAVRIDELILELRRAGFPPKSVTVSRLFPSISFGRPFPSDLELTDSDDKKRSLSSLRRSKRPLVMAFVSFDCPRKKYKKYKAKPEMFAHFKKTIEQFKDRVDFIAVAANKRDKFAETVKFLQKAKLGIPVLHDATGKVDAVFNIQHAPPPHLFIFDGAGLLRYAGDPHNNWEKPERKRENYLEKALNLIFAGKYQANGAVFYNKLECSCSHPHCRCPRCGCGSSCRCGIKHCGTGF